MRKRSYGTGRLFVRCDSGGREVWYGTWWAGGVRVKRRIGLKRSTARADGLTRVQAERELRRRIETDVVIAGAQRRTVAEAGEAYITRRWNAPSCIASRAMSYATRSARRWPRRRPAASDPGMDGPRRRQHDRDLLPLRIRPDAWRRVRAAGVW